MPRRVLTASLLLLLLTASALTPPGRGDAPGQGGYPPARPRPPRRPRPNAAKVRRPRPPTVASVMSEEEQEELAEGFRVAYNLAAAPDLLDVSLIPLQGPRYRASVKGVVIKEKRNELYLDTSPCEPQVRKKQMYTFVSPYEKEAAEEITCPPSAVKIKLTKITQQGRALR